MAAAQTCRVRKSRTTLSPQQAREIYMVQATRSMQRHSIFQRGMSAAAVARQFGVTEKVVRDIWKGRTWCRENSLQVHHLEGDPHLEPQQHENPSGPRYPNQFKELPINSSEIPSPKQTSSERKWDNGANTIRNNDICVIPFPLAPPCFELSNMSGIDDPFRVDWPHW
eukprot:CAMPEP_0113682330 /NCGR_PEP_ID=MMETSP0038_2-20120614/12587_1 /TAXON_ID=2898 /ORGANISM="Cryptomonas paramecium" /LENGTH=167 /DNA_ID=CAMNT_0000601355 /DNA_START=23 /DNA_END=523 /DNA_ORIENTATION=+ /assembly_acc=CAM_ASM_000170